jgi:methylmalonyl-CoA mutase
LKIDNSRVRIKQIERINKIKASRDQKAVDEILGKLTAVAKSGEGNLLELAVEAAKVRATVGEISKALEDVFGRHVPQN